MPKGLKQIGQEAFRECKTLSMIRLPDTLLSIGARAFQKTEDLRTLKIPENVLAIGQAAFWSSGIVGAVIPESVKELGTDLFLYCEDLKAVRISSSLTALPDNIFSDCINLEYCEMPDTVETIKYGAFNHCRKLKSIRLPSQLKKLEAFAFLYSGLEHVIFPDDLEEIGQECFNGCKNLRSVTWNDGLLSIGLETFFACPLEDLVLPETVNYIGKGAFSWGSTPRKVVIPKSVTYLGENAFWKNNGLERLAIYNPECDIAPDFVNKKVILYGYFDSTTDHYVLINGMSVRFINLIEELETEGQHFLKKDAVFSGEVVSDTVSDCMHHFFSGMDLVNEKKTEEALKNKETLIPFLSEKELDQERIESLTDSSNYYMRDRNYVTAFDANLLLKSGDRLVATEDRLKEKIRVFVHDLPEYGKEKDYAVIRIADNRTELLETKNHGNGSISFWTDSFGTFLVLELGEHNYELKEIKKASPNENGFLLYVCSGCGKEDRRIIYAPSTFKLSKSQFIYNGKVQKPGISVIDANGIGVARGYYNICWNTNCRNSGKHSVSIVFTGDRYTGVKTLTYQIGKSEQIFRSKNFTRSLGSDNYDIQVHRVVGDGKISYHSGNQKIVKVDSEGSVTAVGVGKTKIYITAAETTEFNLKTISIIVTVLPKKINL